MSTPENSGFIAGFVRCNVCDNIWICTRYAISKMLECPRCGILATFKPASVEDYREQQEERNENSD
jgi:DNA-directed RNA polymerase subunit M/transcription elongation factor TFIIS